MLQQIILSISPLDRVAQEKCQTRIDNLTKPLNSLEGFERIVLKLAGVMGNSHPKSASSSIILFAGSNCRQTDKNTAGLVKSFCQGVLPVNVLAEHTGANTVLVDIGTAADLTAFPIVHRKIAYGTSDIRQGAAISYEEASQAMKRGIEIAQQEILKGASVLGVGGIHADNALASLAVIAALSQKPLEEIADSNRELKALKDVFNNKEYSIEDPIDVVSKVGDLEMAGLVGVMLGAAANKAVVVLDGMLASAAALLAVRLAPRAKEYLLGSQLVGTSAHKIALEMLEITAYLDLGMTVGQGVGAALGLSLVRASLHMLNDMKTFAEANVAAAQDGPGALRQTGMLD